MNKTKALDIILFIIIISILVKACCVATETSIAKCNNAAQKDNVKIRECYNL